jgi:hypothetical protein
MTTSQDSREVLEQVVLRTNKQRSHIIEQGLAKGVITSSKEQQEQQECRARSIEQRTSSKDHQVTTTNY